MKVLKFFALAAICWMPLVAQAACPIQEAAVEVLNGVDVKKGDARGYAESLRKLVFELHPEIDHECVNFHSSYNTNEPYFLDFLEAGLQKSEEITGSGIAFLKQYFRMLPTADWFDNLVVDLLFVPTTGAIGLGEYFLGDQILEHLEKYAEHTAPSVPGGQRSVSGASGNKREDRG